MAATYAATLHEFSKRAVSPWATLDWTQGGVAWRMFHMPDVSLPNQGWKIHVSAAAIEAAAMAAAVVPVLLSRVAAFKIALTLRDIVLINSGDFGPFQVGKVLTVYPGTDDEARQIVADLDSAWSTSRGPEVQTDLHVRPGSAVSLRYGVYGAGPAIVDSTGAFHFALVSPDGGVLADTRRLAGEQSSLAPEPPVPVVPPRPQPLQLRKEFEVNQKRYVPLTVLSDTPKARIFLGVSIDTFDTVVIKAGMPGIAGDDRGIDVRARLKREFEILSALSCKAGLLPAVLDWRDGEWPLLIMEDFRGELISDLDRGARLECLPGLARALARVHEAGFMHGDIKLENAVRRGQDVGLIDFELAERDGAETGVGGTRGFLSPEVKGYPIASFARDIFALGGCVAHAALGVPPSILPNGSGRLCGLLSLEGANVASSLVYELSNPDPCKRPSALVAASRLSSAIDQLRAFTPSMGVATSASERNWCRRASIEAASLVDRYSKTQGGDLCWRNEHFMSSFLCEGINIGAAGVILGLITIDQALSRTDFTDTIDRGARWLAARSAEGNSAGLFTGNAGVALALAVTGRRLRNQGYLAAAKERLHAAAGDDREVDLFSGSAGVLLACCLISDILEDSWPLELAEPVVRSLNKRLDIRSEIPTWLVDPETDEIFLGCAHGSAGVAMALASWGSRSGDTAAVEIALETFQRLSAVGRTEDSSSLRIKPDSDLSHAVGNWCHGVAGYLWSILLSVGDAPELEQEIDWAVRCMLDSTAVGTPTYCHGLAGQLELWRMLKGVGRFRELACAKSGKTARALRTVHEKIEGRITWCSDDPTIRTPDLWIGFLGPATALAMHASDCRSPLISSAWLQSCATPVTAQSGSSGKRRLST